VGTRDSRGGPRPGRGAAVRLDSRLVSRINLGRATRLALMAVGEPEEELDVLPEPAGRGEVLLLRHPQPAVDELGPGREGWGGIAQALALTTTF
jgi:hypothetical protein